jgi:hypothetical protein
MRKSTFLKHISHLEESELREELKLLYTKLESVKTYYKMELGSTKDREKVYVAAKKEITAKFKTKSYRRPRRPRIQKINTIIRDLSKKAIFSYEMIDVYLHTTITGLQFMNEYRFYSDVLANHIINSFSSACLLIESNRMKEKYEEACQNIILLSKIEYPLQIEICKIYNDILVKGKSS